MDKARNSLRSNILYNTACVPLLTDTKTLTQGSICMLRHFDM